MKALAKDVEVEWKGFWTRNGPEMDREMQDMGNDVGAEVDQIGHRVEESVHKLDNPAW